MIELIQTDITKLELDAIVNAANRSLLGGGGVDGAIHSAAGSELLDECKTLNGCDTGEAKITKAYKLAAKHVIHTVGPVWSGGNNNERDLLANCYINSLTLAKQYGLETIAFPNISTGVYHFPKQLAAETAITAVKEFQAEGGTHIKVLFVCFDDENYRIYEKFLGK
ncbi:MAG: O-acetyl-ADP-ribose deacetylase [Bacteroidetes bacterium]|nr:O-acetyl-ADP-ribose deacetylase [Bacteroidota bacterium]MCK5765536.1 O-acetyl-ADP-ribose deacetylase [Bacteroidales bacterium]